MPIGVKPRIYDVGKHVSEVDVNLHIALGVEVGKRRLLSVDAAFNCGTDSKERVGRAMVGAVAAVGFDPSAEFADTHHQRAIVIDGVEGLVKRLERVVEFVHAFAVLIFLARM